MPTSAAPRALFPVGGMCAATDHLPSTVTGDGPDLFLRDLYQEHGQAVLRYATRLLGGDRHRAEDVLQEAALRAWRYADLLGGDVHGIRPWLWTTVRNLAIDHLRAQKRRPAEVGPVDEFHATVSDGVDNLLLGQVILSALDSLNEQQREVIHLLHFAQLSIQQVSARLNIPPGTVKSRSHYALRALKRAMQEAGALPQGTAAAAAPQEAAA
jgi:RNA polymerase sigma-70 factor (ECF subfamily)